MPQDAEPTQAVPLQAPALLPVVDTEGAAKHALAAIFAAALMASLVYRLDPMGVGTAVRAHCYGLRFSGVHTVLTLNAGAWPVQTARAAARTPGGAPSRTRAYRPPDNCKPSECRRAAECFSGVSGQRCPRGMSLGADVPGGKSGRPPRPASMGHDLNRALQASGCATERVVHSLVGRVLFL